MASKQFNTPSEAHAEGTLFLLLTIPCGCPTSFVRVFPYSDSALSRHQPAPIPKRFKSRSLSQVGDGRRWSERQPK